MNGPAVKTITCRELHELARRQSIDLIDVRTPEEFRDVHAAGARNVPLDSPELFDMLQQPDHASDQPLYFICEVGGRSAHACVAFIAAGHQDVVNVEGGTQAWREAGLPIVNGA